MARRVSQCVERHARDLHTLCPDEDQSCLMDAHDHEVQVSACNFLVDNLNNSTRVTKLRSVKSAILINL